MYYYKKSNNQTDRSITNVTHTIAVKAENFRKKPQCRACCNNSRKFGTHPPYFPDLPPFHIFCASKRTNSCAVFHHIHESRKDIPNRMFGLASRLVSIISVSVFYIFYRKMLYAFPALILDCALRNNSERMHSLTINLSRINY